MKSPTSINLCWWCMAHFNDGVVFMWQWTLLAKDIFFPPFSSNERSWSCHSFNVCFMHIDLIDCYKWLWRKNIKSLACLAVGLSSTRNLHPLRLYDITFPWSILWYLSLVLSHSYGISTVIFPTKREVKDSEERLNRRIQYIILALPNLRTYHV